MKVLLVNDYATPTGGAELLILALREGLIKRGHQAKIFASSACAPNMQSFADYDCLGTLSRTRILLQTLNPWAWLRLRQVLADFQPDVVHVSIALTQLSPLIFSLFGQIPTIYNAQWYRAICPTGTKVLPNGQSCQSPMGKVCYLQGCLPTQDWLLLTMQMKLVRRWFKVFDRVVTPSDGVKQRLVAAGLDGSSIEVVWNGVPVRCRRPALGSVPTVVFAGRLVREKGVDVLLRAFAKVKETIADAKLLIVGEGVEKAALESLAVELNLSDRVSFLGYLSRSALETLFDQAWVQVIPSRWAEPFGLVAAEAQMRGTAIIASDVGGLAEVIHPDQTSNLVPPGDVGVLAEKMLNILSQKELAEALGHQGRAFAIQNFSEDAFVDRFLAVYDDLIRNCCKPKSHPC